MTIPFGLPGLDLHAGEHLCAFYRGSAARDDILTAYLRAGLKAGHKCICALDNTEPEVLRAALGEDLAGDRETGDLPLEIYRSQDVYLAGGEFTIAATIAFWDQRIGAAIGRGFRAAAKGQCCPGARSGKADRPAAQGRRNPGVSTFTRCGPVRSGRRLPTRHRRGVRGVRSRCQKNSRGG